MFRPVGDRVVVKRVEPKKMSAGGIIIPDSAQEKMAEGEVVSIGYGKGQDDGSIRPMDVAVGDRVLFSKFAGTDIVVEEQELLILREEDIFGVLQKKAEPSP
jgi:chaperonin GroES